MYLKLTSSPIIPLFVYLLLATAAILPIQIDDSLFFIHTSFILLALIILQIHVKLGQYAYIAAIYLTPVILLFLLMSFRSQDPEGILPIFEGSIFTTLLTSSLIAIHFKKSSELDFFKKFVRVATVILLLTISYKFLAGGLMDRGIRFFLNGPIVFGWLMGFSAFISVMIYVTNRECQPKYIIYFFVFFLATLWAQSKGPLLATLLVTATYLTINIGSKRTHHIMIIGLITIMCTAPFLPEQLFGRLETLVRIITFTTNSVDAGSIGSRVVMLRDSLVIFTEHPIAGVGVGNWQFHSSVGYLKYPHNIFAEIASQTGIIGVFIIFSLLGLIFSLTSVACRYVMMYFIICMSFSGDFSYFRFVISIPLGFVIAQSHPQIYRVKKCHI